MSATRVLLVDDHLLFRNGIATMLADRGGFEVVGEAGDGWQALAEARQLKPDLILMDIKMPRCNGLEATRLIKAEMPEVNIAMLTVSDEDEDLFEAIKSGAQGYLLKDLGSDDFFGLLSALAAGEVAFSRGLALRVLTEFSRAGREGPREEPGGELSGREQQVLQWLVEGQTNKEIASLLHISEHTVKFHLRNILRKLHAQNRTEVATYALRQGLVKPPEE